MFSIYSIYGLVNEFRSMSVFQRHRVARYMDHVHGHSEASVIAEKTKKKVHLMNFVTGSLSTMAAGLHLVWK